MRAPILEEEEAAEEPAGEDPLQLLLAKAVVVQGRVAGAVFVVEID